MGKPYLKIALVLCMLVLASTVVYAGVINRITINNTVNVLANGVGIYMDQACTAPLSAIAWGDVPRGGSKTFSFYVRAENGNEGTDINVFWDTATLPMSFTLTATLNGETWDKNTSRMVLKGTVSMGIFSLNVGSDVSVQPYIWYTEFRAE